MNSDQDTQFPTLKCMKSNKTLQIPRTPTWIGRSSSSHFRTEGPSTAFNHCSLQLNGNDEWEVRQTSQDLTVVGRVLGADESHTLKDEDVLVVGTPTDTRVWKFSGNKRRSSLPEPTIEAMNSQVQALQEQVAAEKERTWDLIREKLALQNAQKESEKNIDTLLTDLEQEQRRVNDSIEQLKSQLEDKNKEISRLQLGQNIVACKGTIRCKTLQGRLLNCAKARREERKKFRKQLADDRKEHREAMSKERQRSQLMSTEDRKTYQSAYNSFRRKSQAELRQLQRTRREDRLRIKELDRKNQKYSRARRLQRSLENEVDCPVCTEMIVDPVILGCSHTICHVCLLKLPHQECPLCRTPIITTTHSKILEHMMDLIASKTDEGGKERRTALKAARKVEQAALVRRERLRAERQRAARLNPPEDSPDIIVLD